MGPMLNVSSSGCVYDFIFWVRERTVLPNLFSIVSPKIFFPTNFATSDAMAAEVQDDVGCVMYCESWRLDGEGVNTNL